MQCAFCDNSEVLVMNILRIPTKISYIYLTKGVNLKNILGKEYLSH